MTSTSRRFPEGTGRWSASTISSPTASSIALAAILVFAIPREAEACRCVEQTVEEAVAAADLIFAGTVTGVEHAGDPGAGEVRAVINAEMVWKGPAQAAYDVSTADNTAACGFPFEVGTRVIVYGQRPYDPPWACELPPEPYHTHTCTRTRIFALDEAARLDALLGEAGWTAPQPFRRGEVNGDGRWDLSDMVYLLGHLFLGGPGVPCDDALDVNDDGGVDISDGVYGLSWITLGGPPPPAPGPFVAGFDATTDDPQSCGDLRALDCESRSSSTLPGVRIEILDAPCRLTLEEALAGVTFTYRVVVEEEVRVITRPLATCQDPGPSGLYLLEQILGGKESYCICDGGLCPHEEREVDLLPGSYLGTFRWCGRNWYGPSDTVNAPGEPFPPGTYALTIRGEGSFPPAAELPAAPFELSASYDLELAP